MSEKWSERQRQTNKLTRISAGYVFSGQEVTPEQLYGLCQLSWITKNCEVDSAPYILGTKIPALGLIFNKDYSNYSIVEVAEDIVSLTNNNNFSSLIRNHTGFTNFYNAFRNSAYTWIKSNFEVILPLFKDAYNANDNNDRLRIMDSIMVLPRIEKPNTQEKPMTPEHLLTPVFFSLDEELKFPLINGKKGVQSLLSKLGVSKSTLVEQYKSMTGLYGTNGINDAADLDQIGDDLPDFVTIGSNVASKKLLEEKESDGNELTLKDEGDILIIKKSLTIKGKRIHNVLTNKFKKILSKYTLLEGCDNKAMFDVLVQDYNGDSDLLVEVKSSCDLANIRMAVGQLFDYWFNLKGDAIPHLAILVPGEPSAEIINMLDWLDIGIMWLNEDHLITYNSWLKNLEV